MDIQMIMTHVFIKTMLSSVNCLWIPLNNIHIHRESADNLFFICFSLLCSFTSKEVYDSSSDESM